MMGFTLAISDKQMKAMENIRSGVNTYQAFDGVASARKSWRLTLARLEKKRCICKMHDGTYGLTDLGRAVLVLTPRKEGM